MKKKSVLVTGANGFIGRNVCRYFKDEGWNVSGIGYGDWHSGESKKWGIDSWHKSGVSLESLVKYGGNPDVIVHCAGSGTVEISLSNPAKDFNDNVGSILAVLEFMRLKRQEARLVFLSSAAVYGQKKNRPIKEEDKLSPLSPYGFHKRIAEELCESYSKNFNLNISVIRFFSVYGAGLKKQLLWDACEKIRKAKKEIKFFGTGKETRDWINIKDVVSLIYHKSKLSKKFEIINGASGKKTKIKEVLNFLIREYGKEIKLFFLGKEKKGDPKFFHANISKSLASGWSPNILLEDGIREYIEFYKKVHD